jgi:ELWxxDGT repeat protein
MKKIFFAILYFVCVVQISHAQQQVWNLDGGYQIQNSISVKDKIIYGAAAVVNPQLYVTATNQNGALLLGDFTAVSNFTSFGDKIVFIGRKGYDINIWITDGTPQGTIALTSLQHAEINDIVVFNNKIYYVNYNSIYYTDATIKGAQLLLTVPTNNKDPSVLSSIAFLKAVQDKLIYYYYGQLGVTDGTSSVIQFLSDNNATPIIQAYVTATVMNNKLFFINNSVGIGDELWSTDGTDANTKLLKDINVGDRGGFDTINYVLTPWFTSSNGKLYFVANKGTGNAVWVTDGTLNGTSELNMGASYYQPEFLKSIDGNVYFRDLSENNLFFSDGQNNIVQNIGGVQNPNYPYGFIKFNGSVYFVASDVDHGYELWKTDNTASSTTRLTDICAGTCGAFNSYTGLTVCGNILFFSASNFGYDEVEHPYGAEYQLWKLIGNSTTTAVQNAVVETISYYPNPCKEFVTVAFQQPVSNVQLFSVLGNEVKVDWHQDQNKLIIHTQELSSGMYTLLINGDQSIKIIKE